MTRNGKIARLPQTLREQVNRKLDDGLPGTRIVAWLNTLPEVQALMAATFEGRPIRPQNLSEWKAGGYRDWQMRQETLDAVRSLSEDAGELARATNQPLTEMLSVWTAARYAVAARKLAADEQKGEATWKQLRAISHDLMALRKGDHRAQQLRQQQRRLRLAQQALVLRYNDKCEQGFRLIWKETRRHPHVLELWNAFHTAFLNECDTRKK